MDSLRVDTGARKIEVNDDGECIEFCVTDSNFFNGFLDLSKWLEEQKKISRDGESISDEDGNANTAAIDGAVAEYGNIGEQIRERIDKIFGDEASRKIFCGHTPNIFTLSDFIEKITPFIQKYMGERKDAVSKKYNKGRKGAKS